MAIWHKASDPPKGVIDEDGGWTWPVVIIHAPGWNQKLGHYINRPNLKEWRFEGGNFDASEYITHWIEFPKPPQD